MKHMHYKVHVVDQHPSTTSKSFDVLRPYTLLLENADDVLRDRLYLHVRSATGQNEVVRGCRDGPEIQNHDAMRLEFHREVRGSLDLLGELRRLGLRSAHRGSMLLGLDLDFDFHVDLGVEVERDHTHSDRLDRLIHDDDPLFELEVE